MTTHAMSLRLPLALFFAALLALLSLAPVGAATTGTICGQVTAFTAPDGVTEGSITIDGAVETIAADATIDADTVVTLEAIALSDATTCLEIVANDAGVITALGIATEAQVCGTVVFDAETGIYSVGEVAVPAALVAADAELQALLDAAAAANAEACLDVIVSAETGLIVAVSLHVALDLCGTIEAITTDTVTIGGVTVPLSLFDAEARAALWLAVELEADVCVHLAVVETEIVSATLTASLELCGEVTLSAEGDVMIDGVLVPSELLSAELQAVLWLAADADVVACLWVDATSTNGTTSVVIDALVEICATVDAVGDTTITIGDVVFEVGAEIAGVLEVGDEVCLTLAFDDGTLSVIEVDLEADPTAPAPPQPPVTVVPDTAVPASGFLTGLAATLLIASGIGFSVARRFRD